MGKASWGSSWPTAKEKKDVTAFVLDITSKSKTDLLTTTLTLSLASPVAGEFSPDGTVIAVVVGDRVHFWRRNAAEKWRDAGTLDRGKSDYIPLAATAFAPDGKALFVAVLDGDVKTEEGRLPWTIEKWDLAGRRKLDFAAKPITSELWIANAATGDGNTICLNLAEGAYGIDASSGKAKYNAPGGYGSLFVSRDGRNAAVSRRMLMAAPLPAESQQTSICLWNFADGTGQHEVTVQGPGTRFGAFSADARHFVYAPAIAPLKQSTLPRRQ